MDLASEIDRWLDTSDPPYAIRIVSGRAGFGKTCFSVMYATRRAQALSSNPVYIPLHQLSYDGELGVSLNRYLGRSGTSWEDLFTDVTAPARTLILFDGLDELERRGTTPPDTTRRFLTELSEMVERHRKPDTRVNLVVTCDASLVETVAREFRKPGQVLHLLPFYVPEAERQAFYDPAGHLEVDQRREWWKRFNSLADRPPSTVPMECEREDLVEITACPLWSYLLALGLVRGGLDLSRGVNPSLLYRDLLASVHETLEKRNPRRQLSSRGAFFRVLEETAIAAWHENRATISLAGLHDRCQQEGVSSLPDALLDEATIEGPRLLRRCQLETPDSQHRVGFSHSTVRDFLIAERIVRCIQFADEMMARAAEGSRPEASQLECLGRWTDVCGPAPISPSILGFLRNEVQVQDRVHVERWQRTLCQLIDLVLAHGLPLERIVPRMSHREERRAARNAEEALLAAVNACALVTGWTSRIRWPGPKAAGEWLAQLRGQRIDLENCVALECLALMDFSGCALLMGDLFGANLEGATLRGCILTWANLFGANLSRAHLEGAHLEEAYLSEANLRGAHLEQAHLAEAHLKNTRLDGAQLAGANLRGAHLGGVHLERANLAGAHLEGAHFRDAWLTEANLQETNLRKARLLDSHLEGADFAGANLEDADLAGADLARANLERVSAHLSRERAAATLSRARTLANAKLDPGVRAVIEGQHPELLR